MDHQDKGTPNEWIPRNARLVCLTGRQHFNVEPPLSVQHQYQFITPSSMHHVHNHGVFPKINCLGYTVSIGGSCVRKPFKIFMYWTIL